MRFTGLVVHGQKLGRTIGFPTANLMPIKPIVTMQGGVYAVAVQHGQDHYVGVMNIGSRPTVKKNNKLPKEVQSTTPSTPLIGENKYSTVSNQQIINQDITIEVHILDFDKQIYGDRLDIEPITFIRGEMKFDGLEKLKNQISRDVQFARLTLSTVDLSSK